MTTELERAARAAAAEANRIATLAPPLEAALWDALEAGLTRKQVEAIVEMGCDDWKAEQKAKREDDRPPFGSDPDGFTRV